MSNSLPLFHLIAGKPVIVLGEGHAGEARRRLVERAGGVIADEGNTAARLAFIALDDPDTAALRLRERGLLINVTDRPDLCDFSVPSLLERGPVQVAVGTGGVSAGLAKALRLRLETLLPASLGALAQGLFGAREKLRQRFPDAGSRRHALDAALSEGGALDPLAPGSAERVMDWLSGVHSAAGTVHTIRLRSADPDDLTLGEARLLGMADWVVHDGNVPPAILDRARADAVRRLGRGGAVPAQAQGTVIVLHSA